AVVLAACGGSAPVKPAESPDARLAQTEPKEPPHASDSVKEGEAKLSAGDAASARTLFEQAQAADANDARAALDLGIALEMLNDLPGAEKSYRHAIEVKPDFGEALNNLGVLLRDRNELSEAITLLKRAVKASPDSGSAQSNLAMAQEDAGDNTT